MIEFRSNNNSSKLIDLLWQKEIIEGWLNSPRTPEEAHAGLREQLKAVERELTDLKKGNNPSTDETKFEAG